MFEQTFVQTQAQARRPWTVSVSLTAQCGVVLLLLVIPLLHPETLGLIAPPKPRLIATWINQPSVPPPAAHAVAHVMAALTAPAARRPFLYPVVPAHAASVATLSAPSLESAPSDWVGAALPGGTPVLSFALPSASTPKPVAPKPVVNSAPQRVSMGVNEAKLIYSPRPEYPPLAKATHSQGTVKLTAIIGTDGSIRDLHAVSGPPLLVDAALRTVKQWRYQPTLLNGTAVEVVTEIDVNFTLR